MSAQSFTLWALKHKQTGKYRCELNKLRGKFVPITYETRASARKVVRSGGLYTLFRVVRLLLRECLPDTRMTTDTPALKKGQRRESMLVRSSMSKGFKTRVVFGKQPPVARIRFSPRSYRKAQKALTTVEMQIDPSIRVENLNHCPAYPSKRKGYVTILKHRADGRCIGTIERRVGRYFVRVKLLDPQSFVIGAT